MNDNKLSRMSRFKNVQNYILYLYKCNTKKGIVVQLEQLLYLLILKASFPVLNLIYLFTYFLTYLLNLCTYVLMYLHTYLCTY